MEEHFSVFMKGIIFGIPLLLGCVFLAKYLMRKIKKRLAIMIAIILWVLIAGIFSILIQK